MSNFQQLKANIYKSGHFTYLNLTIFNPTDSSRVLEAKFDTNLNIPIIQDPENYVAAVTSFNIPSTAIPIFKFINGSYIITLSYLGVDYSQVLTYVPYSNISSFSNQVYYCQQFLDSINNGFLAAYTALIAANPGVVNAAPYIVYNDGKFTLYCDGVNYNSKLANPVQIFFNDDVFKFFAPMQSYLYGVNLSNNKDAQILVKNNGTGSSTGSLNGTIFAISTEFDAISSWSSIKSVAVLSSTTGIKNHVLLTNSDINGTVGNNIYEPIIASSDLIIKENERNTYIDYDPRFLIYNDITATTPLTHINFRFSYLTKTLNVEPVYLFPGESANLIIQFKHKTILS